MTTFSNDLAARLMDALADLNPKPTYSGRAMFGQKCVSVVISRESEGDLANALEAIAIEFYGDGGQPMNNPFRFTQDSMGLDTVVYWPRASVTDEEAAAWRAANGEDE